MTVQSGSSETKQLCGNYLSLNCIPVQGCLCLPEVMLGRFQVRCKYLVVVLYMNDFHIM